MNRFVETEQRVRPVCAQCGEIAYSNPHVLVSTIVAAGERVLLCRRAAAPAAGKWGLPGGFMESGETLEEGAARETYEETGVRLDPRELQLYAMTTLPEISEVYIGFKATTAEHAGLVCGSECMEVCFFGEVDVPWSELAYPEVGVYLRTYFCERRSGAHAIHFSCVAAALVVSKIYRIAAVEAACRPRATPSTVAD